MKKHVMWASIFGATAILLGALGAHALKAILTPQELESFETAVKYQTYHALYILALALLSQKVDTKWPLYLAVFGTLLFSGSIYLLVADNYLGISLSFLGPITPIGGILLIVSWLTLGIKGMKVK